jgi:hypothetical protein
MHLPVEVGAGGDTPRKDPRLAAAAAATLPLHADKHAITGMGSVQRVFGEAKKKFITPLKVH